MAKTAKHKSRNINIIYVKNAVIISINVLFLCAIAFFAFRGEANITGFAVAESRGVVASYIAVANTTDKATGAVSGSFLPGKEIYFTQAPIPGYGNQRLKLISTITVQSNGSLCSEGDFLQNQYYYDINANGKQDSGEAYVFSSQTDMNGCVIAVLPEEGYKAMLAL
ncbi:MAG TPA: hypothetical protein HA362_01790 [Nanoarchaeota archaeon]|nr:hypothetical protein [Nanoarchaeota archaeon]